MAVEDSTVPWEVRLLQAYCKSDDSLESVSMTKQPSFYI